MDELAYEDETDERGAKPRRPGLPLEPRRVLSILAPERQRLLRVLLAAAAVSLVALFFVPKTYESEAVLVYEGSPIPGNSRGDGTLSAFIQSATVPSRLAEMRSRLAWDVSLEELDDHLLATSVGEDSIRLAARSSSAEEAHLIANTFLEVFLASQTAFNSRQLEQLTKANASSLDRAAERRVAAQAAYDGFREKSGRPDLLEERAQLLARAAELRGRADEAEVDIAAQNARIEELEAAQRDLPRQIVASAQKGSVVEGPLAKARAELAEARATLSEEHPRVQALKQRVARLQSQRISSPVEVGSQTLAANPARTAVDQELAGARAGRAAAQERFSAIQVLIENAEREAEALAPSEGEARRVSGELEAAIASIEELTTREAALRDAQLGPMTGFRVLSVPVVPEEAERSSAAVALVVAVPLFAVLAYVIFILVRALKTLRVEAPREVAWWGRGPVLGTTIWPRDAKALDAFVDELEDQGVYGAGRTLVVPATEAEREVACSFAIRLAEAPWLAAAILDVGERAQQDGSLVTPPPGETPLVTPPKRPPRRLSAQGTPAVAHGRAIPRKPTMQGFSPTEPGSDPMAPLVTPAPNQSTRPPVSSRPPSKRTVIGLPAAKGSQPPMERWRSSSPPPTRSTGTQPAHASAGPQPFRRKRDVRATVRMMVPVRPDNTPPEASPANDADEGQALLLTRPVPVAYDPPRVGRAVHVATEMPRAQASNAVMQAAVRLLGNDDDDVTQLRRSEPPAQKPSGDEVSGVAIAWNGPLSGPVLRRAARLAHRVIVVVSSGSRVVDLARVQTRLGRHKGMGFVLVNLEDAYVDLEDRVGPVEEFWQGEQEPGTA